MSSAELAQEVEMVNVRKHIYGHVLVDPDQPVHPLSLITLLHTLDIQGSQAALTFTILWANSADDKLVLFFSYFTENRIWHFMQIVSNGDNLHEMLNPVFWKNKKKYFKMSSAENFTQNAKR